MFEVFYYHEKLGKWIKACNAKTEEEAKSQCTFLKALWKQPTKYVKN